ncbi:class I SAM-dependent methyltransferase [Actinoplanes sp. NBC_00393]|uniref:class I SAM-dependent methyltransferase n=1 Tax=Actinoplanes sp. NBC_00393 TaxID=2975953 RepID=UPI002E1E8635
MERGLSTAALAPLAEHVSGLEAVPAMLAHCRTVAPQAQFVIGAAEQLPFGAGMFDLVTAAGSLNYADLRPALSEAARALARGGKFLLYDFSEGRHSESGDALADWFRRFRAPVSLARLLAAARPARVAPCGLRLLDYTDVELRLPTTFDAYLRDTVSEVNVEAAITRGACNAVEARGWCRDTLAPVFAAGDVTVVIPGYVATLSRDDSESPLRRTPRADVAGTRAVSTTRPTSPSVDHCHAAAHHDGCPWPVNDGYTADMIIHIDGYGAPGRPAFTNFVPEPVQRVRRLIHQPAGRASGSVRSAGSSRSMASRPQCRETSIWSGSSGRQSLP